jgi:adenylate cyclase
VRTLHPQSMGLAYRWSEDDGKVESFELSYALMQMDEYRDSPFVPIYEGAAGIRRRLDIEDPVLDVPILEELHVQGISDYVAMPLVFSDGSIHALTMCSRRPGGFLTSQLGHLYEVLAVLERLYEVHANRAMALNVLDTYLGKMSGERVLEGLVRRGDHDDINAIIWFCDLRNSTPLAASMSRHEFLGLLNQYFDAIAAPITEHGGEILRFIGDAALAIFPIGESCQPGAHCDAPQALEQALGAIDSAVANMAALNERRAGENLEPLGFGIGIHQGEVTYGNIGTDGRLEFTVVGDAANVAARVEAQCKELEQPVLASANVARLSPQRFSHVADVELRGVDGVQAMYTVSGAA